MRLVIYRLGSLGDTMVALPALRVVARAWPDAERIVFTNHPPANGAAMATVLAGSGLAHRFMEYQPGERRPLALWRLGRSLALLGADRLIYLTEPRGGLAVWRDLAFFRGCGFRHIIGAPVTADLRCHRRLSEGWLWESEAARLARCLAPLGPAGLDRPENWAPVLSAAEQAEAERLLTAWPVPAAGFLVLAPGLRQPAKDWGGENLAALVGRLQTAFPTLGLVLVGGDGDRERVRRLVLGCRGPVFQRCGADLRTTMALIARARLLVGTDGGPMHVAAGLGVPVVALFGLAERPGVWFPAGRGHSLLYRSRLADTVVDAVFEACARQLSAPGTASLGER